VTRPHLRPFLAILVLSVGLAACGLPPARPDTPERAAVRLVMSAERAMGGSDALARIYGIVAEARCNGPNGEFTTRVETLLPDSVRFRQLRSDRPPLDILVLADRGWRFDPEGGNTTVDEPLRAMVRGHELHAMVVRMLDRFPVLQRAGDVEFAGQPCLALEGTDVTGRPATVYLRAADAVPAGFRLTDPLSPDAEVIVVDLGDWRQVGDVQLFHQATFTTRSGVYRYTYGTVSLDLGDAWAFEPPE
jgi:hypothetical protein